MPGRRALPTPDGQAKKEEKPLEANGDVSGSSDAFDTPEGKELSKQDSTWSITSDVMVPGDIDDEPVLSLSSWMQVRGIGKKYSKKFWVMDDGALFHFKDEKGSTVPDGTILLDHCEVGARDAKKEGFGWMVRNVKGAPLWAGPTGRKIDQVLFLCETEELRNQWISCAQYHLELAKNRHLGTPLGPVDDSQPSDDSKKRFSRFRRNDDADFMNQSGTLMLDDVPSEVDDERTKRLMLCLNSVFEDLGDDASSTAVIVSRSGSEIRLSDDRSALTALAYLKALTPADAKSVVRVTGWIDKKGQTRHSWRTRWLVVRPTHLTYSKKDKDPPKGTLDMTQGFSFYPEGCDEPRFAIIMPDRILMARAPSVLLLKAWMRLFEVLGGNRVEPQSHETGEEGEDSSESDVSDETAEMKAREMKAEALLGQLETTRLEMEASPRVRKITGEGLDWLLERRGTSGSSCLEVTVEDDVASWKDEELEGVEPQCYNVGDSDSNILVILGERGRREDDIRGGTLAKLVERFSNPRAKNEFREDFLLIHKALCSSGELMRLLRNRFRMVAPDSSNPMYKEWLKTEKGAVPAMRHNMPRLLDVWVKNYFEDFVVDKDLCVNFVHFINGEGQTKEFNKLRASFDMKLHEHVLSIREADEQNDEEEVQREDAASTASVLADLSPADIAEHISYGDQLLFSAITPRELVGLAWTKNGEERAPNVLRFVHRFNEISHWIASQILSCGNLARRIATLEVAVQAAHHCRLLGNYNGVMAITSALDSAHVHRLERTWAGLSAKTKTKFEKLKSLTGSANNYRVLRRVLDKAFADKVSCIPFMGMYQTDLTFNEEGNKNTITSAYPLVVHVMETDEKISVDFDMRMVVKKMGAQVAPLIGMEDPSQIVFANECSLLNPNKKINESGVRKMGEIQLYNREKLTVEVKMDDDEDDSTTTVVVDPYEDVAIVLCRIVEAMNMGDPRDFELATTRNPLMKDLPLYSQGWAVGDELILAYQQVHLTSLGKDTSERHLEHLLKTSEKTVLTGRLPLLKEEAVALGSMLYFIKYGQAGLENPKSQNELAAFLPPAYNSGLMSKMSTRSLLKDAKQYEGRRGFDMKILYIKTVCSNANFGGWFQPCKFRMGNTKKSATVYFGVTKGNKNLRVLDAKKLSVIIDLSYATGMKESKAGADEPKLYLTYLGGQTVSARPPDEFIFDCEAARDMMSAQVKRYLVRRKPREERKEEKPPPVEDSQEEVTLLNFGKQHQTSSIVRRVLQHQANPRSFVPNPFIRKIFLSAVSYDPIKLYDVSLILEPRKK